MSKLGIEVKILFKNIVGSLQAKNGPGRNIFPNTRISPRFLRILQVLMQTLHIELAGSLG